jgi:hypothetical protein
MHRHTAKRPADIMIRLSPPAKQTNKQTNKPVAKLQLLDITNGTPPMDSMNV